MMGASALEAIIGIVVFVVGYAVIAFEHPLKINKAAPALLTGVIIWTVHMIFSGSADISLGHHSEHTAEISSILFFIMAAMTIVELMDAHGGFEIITERIQTRNLRSLLWIIGVVTFFLSAILDNMTTAIIMCTLLSKILDRQDARWTFVGIIVIAANAGGAWSPIGDVTTIMLWVGGQITTWNIIASLFLPSLVALFVPLIWFHVQMKNSTVVRPTMKNTGKEIGVSKSEQWTVFILGLSALLSVPVFKSLTHLPPYMGAMLGIGILWIYTESIHKHKEEERGQFRIKATLQRIDHSSILFFLGILLAVAGLEEMHILTTAASWLDEQIGNVYAVTGMIGALSAIVDNVPLVAAGQGMYSMTTYPVDHTLWEALAYCAGTGGSMLVIGSAAGVAAQGISGIPFGWYVRRITIPAMLGYVGGLAAFYIMNTFFR